MADPISLTALLAMPAVQTAIGVGGAGLMGLMGGLFGGEDSPADAGTTDPRMMLMGALTGGSWGFDEDTNTFEYRGGNIRNSPFYGAQGQYWGQMFSDMRDPTAAGTAAGNIASGVRGDNPGALEKSFYETIDNLDSLLGPSHDKLMELVDTGLPVGIDPIINSRLYDYNNKFMPSLLERMPGGNLDTSYTSSLGAREAGRVSSELGQLDYKAQEEARARQLEAVLHGVPAYSAMETARGILPQAYISDLYNLSNQERGDRPGNIQWNRLMDVMGTPSLSSITQAAQPSAGSQILASMSQVLPAIARIATNPGGGGGGNSTLGSGNSTGGGYFDPTVIA